MYIAIDDTYGPDNKPQSRYITGQRRTSVGVVFKDDEVEHVRYNLKECLKYINVDLGVDADEFHFTELFNRRGPWSVISDDTNIKIIAAFVQIYYQNQWPVHIQTIEDWTLSDHNVDLTQYRFDHLDLSDPAHLSLCFLLLKVKSAYINENEPLVLYVDEGICKAGKEFGNVIFHDWPRDYSGFFESSTAEPLLQLADFMAFSINRMTYLSVKDNRTPFDLEVMELLGSMAINSSDLRRVELARDFSVDKIDECHDRDRLCKQLPRL